MKTTRTALLVLATAALAAVAGAARAQEPQLTYSGSLQYATGDYTLSETTTSFLLFNGFSYRKGKWNFTASIPLIDQDSPYVTYVGGTPVPSGRRQGVEAGTTSTTGSSSTGSTNGSGTGTGGTVVVPDPQTVNFSESGLGDPVFRADFAVSERQASGVRFGVYGAAKPPLADEDSGFGTGEWDYGAGITVSKRAGSALFLADLGYWIFGDLPDFELEDPFAYSFGLGRSLEGSRYSVLGSVSGYTETVDGVDGPIEAGFTVSRLNSSGRSFNVTLSAGLTESAPDYAVSTGCRVGL